MKKRKAVIRRRNKLLSQWIKAAIVILPIMILLYLGASALWRKSMEIVEGSSLAILNKIEVTGLESIPEFEILKSANVKMGSNLMRLSLDSVATRITEMERVRQARVVRKLPGRLIIKVTERSPLAAISGGDLLLADKEGVVFYPVYGGETIDLPIITGLNQQKYPDAFKEVLEITDHIKTNFPIVYISLGELNVSPENGISLILRQSGAKVLMKDIHDDETLETLEIFLKGRGSEISNKVTYVDLRKPGMIITGTDPGSN